MIGSGRNQDGRRLFAMALAIGGAGPALASDAFSTDWAHAAKSEARLVAASPSLAGFEIRLAPGAITYWRDPGEAGVPPSFDTSGSENVASVEAVFPAPKRIPESDGSDAFGYENDVVLPLRVTAKDAAKPVRLDLRANYAVCEKICLPAEARLSLTLPKGPSPYGVAVDAAVAAAPTVVKAEAFVGFEPAGEGAWKLCLKREGDGMRDLFVEAPPGWWVTASPAASDAVRDCFEIALRDKPKEAALPVTLRLTATGGSGAVETNVVAR